MTSVTQPPVSRTGYELVQRQLSRNERGKEPSSVDEELSLTGKEVADRLTRTGHRWHDSNHNGRTELTYEFSTVEPDSFKKDQIDSRNKARKFVPLNARQKDYVRTAQQEYADIANISFTEKAGGGAEGHLIYNGYDTGSNVSPIRGSGFFPDPQGPERPGHVWMRNTDQASRFNEKEDGGFLEGFGDDIWRENLIHEIGHIVGLSHPHGDSEEEGLPDYQENWKNYSIMSYNTPLFSEAEDSGGPVSLMIDDIAALQKTYGANHATRAGDTTYGFNSNSGREHSSLTSSDDKPLFAVWDGGGWDTLDFSGFSQNQVINLNAGSLSSVGGLSRNVGIAEGAVIEEARGGKGRNILIGNEVFNVLRGGPGEDVMYGGSGGAQMWGGAGPNTFVFDGASSGKANWVMDFVSGKDKIDLSGLSKKLGTLTFVSQLPLDHSKPQDPVNPTFLTKPGDVLVSYDRAFGRTFFRLDTTGDGRMDMCIDVQGKVVRKDVVV